MRPRCSHRLHDGALLCVAATILMGIMFPVMTSALRHVDPFTFTSLRYMIASSAFLVLLRVKEGSFLFILMSFAGVALVVTKGDIAALLSEPQNYSANALIVVGALCWVIYTFSASYFKTWSALKYTTMTTWLGLTTIIGLNALLFALHVVPIPTAAALIAIVPHLLYMGPVAGFVAILFWNMGNRMLTPLNGVLFMDVLPVTTFVVSAVSGLIPTHMQIAGACMTGSALILNNLYLRRRAQRLAAGS
jgi:drug/metabolite transporter (DMT)-like permease